MKTQEKLLAISLREQGKSVKEIAKVVNVSSSTVSGWVGNVKLTDQQRKTLKEQQYRFSISNWKSKTCRQARLDARKIGEQEAVGEPLHVAGCMLFWAEGTKSKSSVIFTNSDPNMMKLFIRFLREIYDIKNDEVSLFCAVHDCDNTTFVEDFWCEELGLKRENLRKTQIIKSGTGKKNKHLYGIARIAIYNMKIVQRIYGAITKYAEIAIPKWQ